MFTWLLAFTMLQEPIKKYPEWECVRWTWTGDVFNRTVICLEWRKRK